MKRTCKPCRKEGTVVEFDNVAALRQHLYAVHPGYVSEYAKRKSTGKSAGSPIMEKVLAAKKVLVDSIKDLDFERNEHMNRVKEIDNIIAELKKIV